VYARSVLRIAVIVRVLLAFVPAVAAGFLPTLARRT